MMPQPGDVFGRYEIVRELGRGGMGVVFAAVHRELRRDVALKLLAPELANDLAYRNRFLREAQVLARIDSPHVVRVHDAGEEDGWLFIATELLPDGDLDDLVPRGQGLAPALALDITAQVADALAVVHAQGILHRDIKPSNVLVRRTPAGVRAVVCDFGIASADEVDHTRTVGVIGTPSYMAPERHEGRDATVATDVYAVGCLLWALLTGEPPYTGTPSQVILGHLQGAVPALAPNWPQAPAINRLLADTLAKDPQSRISGAAELAARAREIGRPAGATPPPGPPPPPRLPTVGSPTGGPTGSPTGGPPLPVTIGPGLPPLPNRPNRPNGPNPDRGTVRAHRSRLPVVLGALAVLAIVAAVAVAVVLLRDDEDPTDRRAGESGDPAAGEGSAAEPACDVKLGFVGPVTGDLAAFAEAITRGIGLALGEYNTDAPCPVELVTADSQGAATTAKPAVEGLIADPGVIGVIGPTFSGESAAVGGLFADAGLVTITPTATGPSLADNGWSTFHRGIGNDLAQVGPTASYLDGVLDAEQVVVVHDDSELGELLGGAVTEELGPKVVDSAQIGAGQTDFADVVRTVTSAGPDAMYFAGYSPELSKLLAQLRRGGFDGPVVAADGVFDQTLLDTGAAAEGTVVTCTCAPTDLGSASAFREAYLAEYDAEPAIYSAEAYAATRVLLDGIGRGRGTRADLLAFVDGYDGDGITGPLSWTDAGEPTDPNVYAYVVEGGDFRSEGVVD